MPQPYPHLEPYATHRLSVGDGHELYVEECGNPHGKPAVVLHGGPGGGSSPKQRRFFDPDAYRVVLFDQRGCGASTPHASVDHNTTWDLVADVERVRTHLGIDRWLVFGGSWGSCLALSYAQEHPDAVTELVLRGIFLLRRSELEFFYQDGASHLFPEAWEAFVAPIPPAERGDLMAAYHRRLFGDDDAERLRCAEAWSAWESATSHLVPEPDPQTGDEALAFARIENHYFVNGGFFAHDGQLLDPDRVARICDIPAVIVQGRYDVVCPVRTAWDLHRAWPAAHLVVTLAGHSMYDPANAEALVAACDRFRGPASAPGPGAVR